VAKKSKVKSAAPGSAAVPPGALPPNLAVLALGYDPTKPLEQRHITGVKEGWSEYSLDDGTVLMVKQAVVDVKRAKGQWNPQGEPVYIIQAATLVSVKRVPKRLMRKRK
jgi:hypothetical protein